jgi:hypothetical protein
MDKNFENQSTVWNVSALFSVSHLRTCLVPPGDFFEHPQKDWGNFIVNDNEGDIELAITSETSVDLTVKGSLPHSLLDSLNEFDHFHQACILKFYSRAFNLLNTFIDRYRIRTFNNINHPVTWSYQINYDWAGPAEFLIESPICCSVTWYVEGFETDILQNFKIITSEYTPWRAYKGYQNEALKLISQDIGDPKGNEEKTGSLYEVALELLLQAQDIIGAEARKREHERQSAVVAALIITATACEIFVRDFARRHGSPLHKFLLKEKERVLSVGNILDEILPDISLVGQSLADVNAELRHNIQLLFDARNKSAHKGRPVVFITEKLDESDSEGKPKRRTTVRECPIEPWMIYFEIEQDWSGYAETTFGSFVLDVLALIEWLRSFEGGDWLKLGIRDYFDNQSKQSVRTRERALLENTDPTTS